MKFAEGRFYEYKNVSGPPFASITLQCVNWVAIILDVSAHFTRCNILNELL